MGILERIKNRFSPAARRDFVLGPAVVDPADAYWGHDATPFKPEEYAAYLASSNGVYTCATLRAELLASLPLRFYQGQGEKRVEKPDSPAARLVKYVNPFWTLERLIRMTELSNCIWGEAFWFLDRGQSGRGAPAAIYWGRSDRVRVVPDEKKYVAGYLYTPVGAAEPIPFEPQEVVWMPYANIIDEFAGLSPLAAARLAADTASASMQANRKMFENGLHLGGIVMPPPGGNIFPPEQAKTLSELFDRRFKGIDKAHRWAVMQFEVQTKEMGNVTPRDAEYLGGLAQSLSDIARAYHVPLDLVGGQRTYQNFEAAMKAVWTLAVLPQARWIAAELNEKLLCYFPDVDECEFDASGIAELQEAETERWAREREQIDRGAITINEWRAANGLTPVAWGDDPLVGGGLKPVSYLMENPGGPAPAPLEPPAQGEDAGEAEEAAVPPEEALTARRLRATIPVCAPAYGSPEHRRLMGRFETRANKMEGVFARKLKPLLERQRDEALGNLRVIKALAGLDGALGVNVRGTVADNPFDRDKWDRILGREMAPVYREIVDFAGQAELDDLGIALKFNLSAAGVKKFLAAAAQRFAEQVNETTWQLLRDSLGEAVTAGESVSQMQARVEAIMVDRIRSSSETIARTEVLRCYTGAENEAWRQSGVVEARSWLAALDDRTRADHEAAHGQTVGLNEPFEVGGVKGDGPGLMGAADQDINCRCTVIAVLEKRGQALKVNGRQKERAR
jgi:HK97 family phage portal protein